MLHELRTVLAHLPSDAARVVYSQAIVEHNALGKRTEATRRLTDQRLGELYALDIGVTLFRVLRDLWPLDPQAQPQLTILCALARDPLLEGRTRKIRRRVVARPASATYAIALGYLLGQRGQRLFRTFWASALDSSADQFQALAAIAKRQGLLDMKVSGDVVEIHFPSLLTAAERTEGRGTD